MDNIRSAVRASFGARRVQERSAIEESARTALIRNKPEAKSKRRQENAYSEDEFSFIIENRAGLVAR